jgi:hypothetical protein
MEERRAVARRLFEALCAHYPDRYIALVEQPANANPTAKINSWASPIPADYDQA